MFRRLVVGFMAAGLLVIAPPTFAQPTTVTTHEKGLVENFVDILPNCDESGPLYAIRTTSNLVMHETTFADGRVHSTFHQTGRFRAVPLEDRSLPSYTGKFNVGGGFNQNRKTVNGSFNFHVRGTGSDGSTLNFHSVEHFNVRPDGTVHEFFHCR